MPACLKCGSEKVIEGRLCSSGKSWAALFRPKSIRWFALSLFGGVFVDSKSFGCPDCGLVWSSTSPGELRTFVEKHCRKS